MARPSRYTNAVGDAICERIAEGESLVSICRDPEMPAYSTVMSWLASGAQMYSGFLDKYAHARDTQAERYAQEIVDIADTARPEDASVAKLRIDARKWVASKLLPKKYGTDRIEQRHVDRDGNDVPQVAFRIIDTRKDAEDTDGD